MTTRDTQLYIEAVILRQGETLLPSSSSIPTYHIS